MTDSPSAKDAQQVENAGMPRKRNLWVSLNRLLSAMISDLMSYADRIRVLGEHGSPSDEELVVLQHERWQYAKAKKDWADKLYKKTEQITHSLTDSKSDSGFFQRAEDNDVEDETPNLVQAFLERELLCAGDSPFGNGDGNVELVRALLLFLLEMSNIKRNEIMDGVAHFESFVAANYTARIIRQTSFCEVAAADGSVDFMRIFLEVAEKLSVSAFVSSCTTFSSLAYGDKMHRKEMNKHRENMQYTIKDGEPDDRAARIGHFPSTDIVNHNGIIRFRLCDPLEVLTHAFYNQTGQRIPLAFLLLNNNEFVWSLLYSLSSVEVNPSSNDENGANEQNAQVVHAESESNTEKISLLHELWQTFFEDIASEQRAIPKEEGRGEIRLRLIRHMLQLSGFHAVKKVKDEPQACAVPSSTLELAKEQSITQNDNEKLQELSALSLNEFLSQAHKIQARSIFVLNPDAEGADGLTFFTRACFEGDIALVDLFLEYESATGKEGDLGLPRECQSERILDESRVGQTERDNTSGHTPLMTAVLGNAVEVVRRLLEIPRVRETIDYRCVMEPKKVLVGAAKRGQRSKDGLTFTAADLAHQLRRDPQIIDLLNAHGMNMQTSTSKNVKQRINAYDEAEQSAVKLERSGSRSVSRRKRGKSQHRGKKSVMNALIRMEETVRGRIISDWDAACSSMLDLQRRWLQQEQTNNVCEICGCWFGLLVNQCFACLSCPDYPLLCSGCALSSHFEPSFKSENGVDMNAATSAAVSASVSMLCSFVESPFFLEHSAITCVDVVEGHVFVQCSTSQHTYHLLKRLARETNAKRVFGSLSATELAIDAFTAYEHTLRMMLQQSAMTNRQYFDCLEACVHQGLYEIYKQWAYQTRDIIKTMMKKASLISIRQREVQENYVHEVSQNNANKADQSAILNTTGSSIVIDELRCKGRDQKSYYNNSPRCIDRHGSLGRKPTRIFEEETKARRDVWQHYQHALWAESMTEAVLSCCVAYSQILFDEFCHSFVHVMFIAFAEWAHLDLQQRVLVHVALKACEQHEESIHRLSTLLEEHNLIVPVQIEAVVAEEDINRRCRTQLVLREWWNFLLQFEVETRCNIEVEAIIEADHMHRDLLTKDLYEDISSIHLQEIEYHTNKNCEGFDANAEAKYFDNDYHGDAIYSVFDITKLYRLQHKVPPPPVLSLSPSRSRSRGRSQKKEEKSNLTPIRTSSTAQMLKKMFRSGCGSDTIDNLDSTLRNEQSIMTPSRSARHKQQQSFKRDEIQSPKHNVANKHPKVNQDDAVNEIKQSNNFRFNFTTLDCTNFPSWLARFRVRWMCPRDFGGMLHHIDADDMDIAGEGEGLLQTRTINQTDVTNSPTENMLLQCIGLSSAQMTLMFSLHTEKIHTMCTSYVAQVMAARETHYRLEKAKQEMLLKTNETEKNQNKLRQKQRVRLNSHGMNRVVPTEASKGETSRKRQQISFLKHKQRHERCRPNSPGSKNNKDEEHQNQPCSVVSTPADVVHDVDGDMNNTTSNQEARMQLRRLSLSAEKKKKKRKPALPKWIKSRDPRSADEKFRNTEEQNETFDEEQNVSFYADRPYGASLAVPNAPDMLDLFASNTYNSMFTSCETLSARHNLSYAAPREDGTDAAQFAEHREVSSGIAGDVMMQSTEAIIRQDVSNFFQTLQKHQSSPLTPDKATGMEELTPQASTLAAALMSLTSNTASQPTFTMSPATSSKKKRRNLGDRYGVRSRKLRETGSNDNKINTEWDHQDLISSDDSDNDRNSDDEETEEEDQYGFTKENETPRARSLLDLMRVFGTYRDDNGSDSCQDEEDNDREKDDCAPEDDENDEDLMIYFKKTTTKKYDNEDSQKANIYNTLLPTKSYQFQFWNQYHQQYCHHRTHDYDDIMHLQQAQPQLVLSEHNQPRFASVLQRLQRKSQLPSTNRCSQDQKPRCPISSVGSAVRNERGSRITNSCGSKLQSATVLPLSYRHGFPVVCSANQADLNKIAATPVPAVRTESPLSLGQGLTNVTPGERLARLRTHTSDYGLNRKIKGKQRKIAPKLTAMERHIEKLKIQQRNTVRELFQQQYGTTPEVMLQPVIEGAVFAAVSPPRQRQ